MVCSNRTTLTHLFRSGVIAVKGDNAVRSWLANEEITRPTHVLAAGKAAVAMFAGLPEAWRNAAPTLLITKTVHIGTAVFESNVTALEASHPMPDATSLRAGQSALEFVTSLPAQAQLLVLISGGASSLVEHLDPGVTLSDLEALTHEALCEGADIAEINRRRRSISAIKGGKLLSHFGGKSVHVLAISDVCGDGIDVIGSGLAAAHPSRSFLYRCDIIASNAVARDAVVQSAAVNGLKVVVNQESLYADVTEVASEIANVVNDGPNGLYVFGGEPTVVLPQTPGKGGRNQALALELARHFRKRTDISGLVAGTDGTDGPTNAAGAYLDGKTFETKPGAEAALKAANSGTYLELTGDQLITGPTGTNVMDLALLLKHE